MQNKQKSKLYLIGGYFLTILLFSICMFGVYALANGFHYNLSGKISYTLPVIEPAGLTAKLLDTTDLSVLDSGEMPIELTSTKNITDCYDIMGMDARAHMANFKVEGLTGTQKIEIVSAFSYTDTGVDEVITHMPLAVVNTNCIIDSTNYANADSMFSQIAMAAVGQGSLPEGQELLWSNEDLMSLFGGGGQPEDYLLDEYDFSFDITGDENGNSEFYILYYLMPNDNIQETWKFVSDFVIAKAVTTTIYQVDKTGSSEVFEPVNEGVALISSANYTATATPYENESSVLLYNFEIINITEDVISLDIDLVSCEATVGSAIVALSGNYTISDLIELDDEIGTVMIGYTDPAQTLSLSLENGAVVDGKFNFAIYFPITATPGGEVDTVFSFTLGVATLDVFEYQLMNNSYYAVRLKDNAPQKVDVPATYNNLPVKELAPDFYSGPMAPGRLEVTLPDSIEYIYGGRSLVFIYGKLILSENIKSINDLYVMYSEDFVLPSKLNIMRHITIGSPTEVNPTWSGTIDITIPQNVVYIVNTYFDNPDSVTLTRTSGWSSFDTTSKAITSVTASDMQTALASYNTSLYLVFLNANDASPDYYYHYMDPENNEISIISRETKSGAVSISPTVTYSSTTYTVTAIGPSCFRGSTEMTSVTIPEGVKYIHDYAFAGCTGLTSITIPSSVEYIGQHAFDGCTDLTQVIYADNSSQKISLKYIDASAFNNCTGLTRVTLQSNDSLNRFCTNINYGDETSNPLRYARNLYVNSTLVTSITLPEGTLWLNNYVFAGAKNVTTITMPDSLYILGEGTFYNCEDLTSITLPENIKSIPDNLLYGCKSITTLTIPESVTEIGSNGFYGMRGVETLNYNCININSASSQDFKNLGADGDGIVLNIGENVTKIIKYMFYWASDCGNVNEVRFLGNKVTQIESDAFDRASDHKVYLPELDFWFNINFESAGTNPLNSAKHLYVNNVEVSVITVPNGVTAIKDYAFYGCNCITSVYMPTGVTSIGDYAFYGCNCITSVYMSTGVTSIGDYAFENCKNLDSVVIPSGMTEIGSMAFYGCRKLLEIYNLSNLTIEIGSQNNGYVAYYAKNIRLQDQESKITELNNVRYYMNSSTDYTAINVKSNSITTISLDSKTTEICDYAFDNRYLQSVTINAGLKKIGKYAFNDCHSLTTVTFEANSTLEEIGGSAFYNCNVTSLSLPSSLCTIGGSAFANNTSLNSLSFGSESNLAEIGAGIVNGCTSLTTLTIPESILYIPKQAFSGSSLTSVTFENPYGWKTQKTNYFIIIPIASDVSISASDLQNTSTAATYLKSTYIQYHWKKNLLTYSLDSTNKTCAISVNADNKSQLGRNLYISSTLSNDGTTYTITEITDSGFIDCVNIKTVHIPKTVKYIGQNAFSGCTNLTSAYFKDPTRWFVADTSSATSGTSLAEANLANKSVAATYLTANYVSKYWLSSVDITFVTDLDYSDIAREKTVQSTVYSNNISNVTVPTKSGYKFAGYFVDYTNYSSWYTTSTSGSNVTYKFKKASVVTSMWVVIKLNGSGLSALSGANSQYYSYSSDGTVGYFIFQIADLSLDSEETNYEFTFDKSLVTSHSLYKIGKRYYDNTGSSLSLYTPKKDSTFYAYWVYDNWQPV